MKKQLLFYILASVCMYGAMTASQKSDNNKALLSLQLINAAEQGDAGKVEQLLEQGADVNTADKWGRTPLFMATWKGHYRVVTQLLAAHADVNKANNWGKTPLFFPAAKGHDNVVAQLLKEGADANAADSEGWIPLFCPAANGYDAVVAQLLAAGANVNAANKEGDTPLYIAALQGHDTIVAKLLAAGANVDIKQDPYAQLPDDKKDMLNKLITEHADRLVQGMMREVVPTLRQLTDQLVREMTREVIPNEESSSRGSSLSSSSSSGSSSSSSSSAHVCDLCGANLSAGQQHKATCPTQNNNKEKKEQSDASEALDVRKIANAVHFIVNEKSQRALDSSVSSVLESTSSSGFGLNPDEYLLAWKVYMQLSDNEKSIILQKRADSNNVLALVNGILQKIVATEAAKGAKSQTLSTRMSNEPSEYEQAQEFGMSLEEYREQKDEMLKREQQRK